MALARRSGGRLETNIWPGFVDAMTALLLILMFVMSIFMILQFTMSEKITGQTKEHVDLHDPPVHHEREDHRPDQGTG
jgi:chemotaxis protein MotB